MKLFSIVRRNSLFLIMGGLVTLCFGFIILGCGTDPQLKITDPDTGQFAVDFSKCPSTSHICRGLLLSSSFENDSSKTIAGKHLTLEAWVKSGTSDPDQLVGGIVGRFDLAGITLFFNQGVPKVGIRKNFGTSTSFKVIDYIAESDSAITDNDWHHIAGVLTSEDQSSGCGAVVGTQQPHLAIYVDGSLKNCASTFGATDDTATAPQFAGEPGNKIMALGVFAENLTSDIDTHLVDGINQSVSLPAAIDEVRLWGTARTLTQIDLCNDQELSNDSTACGRGNDDLLGYIRLNEGKDDVFNDWKGLGSGGLEVADDPENPTKFTHGWIDGPPITKKN